MRKIIVAAFLALAAFAFYAAPASAQGVTRICVESIGANGSNNCVEASKTNPFPVTTTAGGGSAFTIPGCTVGTSSAQCLAAGLATNHVQIQNTSSGTTTIACAWGTAAVLNSSTSVQLIAGASSNWGPPTGGVPNTALNCIASAASSPLYLEYN